MILTHKLGLKQFTETPFLYYDTSWIDVASQPAARPWLFASKETARSADAPDTGALMGPVARQPRHGAMDAILGDRIRRRRREMQLSQSALGAKLGITFQQVQKYENGSNRVSATMLVKISHALEMSVLDLLREVDACAEPSRDEDDTARLTADFARISSPELRKAVLTLVAGLSR